MRMARARDARVAGGSLVALGALALVEARRLGHLRTQMVAGAVVGDDTFPWLLGAALVVLGLACLFATFPPVPVVFPRGMVRAQMLLAAGVLAGYWALVPVLGYTASTALAAVALFRTMGGYGWGRALLFGGVTTGLLYLIFRVWLRQPLPGGWLGF